MKNKTYLKKNLLFVFLFFLFTNSSISDVIKEFSIEGNNRVANETIIMFSNLEIGDQISQKKLNEALKDLYYTDYFKDVKITSVNQVIKINVVENPIIQKITIKGIKKNKIKDKISEISSKLEKYPFVENKINEQVNLLKNILRSYGYYFVKLQTSINTNSNNTVDLVYDFELGEIAKIKKINFIGNKIFRDNTLRNIVISEENKFWKFITQNKL